MTGEYQQALNELERLRENAKFVDPEFYEVIDLEIQAAEKRVTKIIKEIREQ